MLEPGLEAEEAAIELARLGLVEDAQDRHRFHESDAIVRRAVEGGASGVPVVVAKAGGHEFEGGRVRDCEVAGGQRGAQPLGHGLGLVDGRHGALPKPAAVRRCPRCRPVSGQGSGGGGRPRCFHHPVPGARGRQHQPGARLPPGRYGRQAKGPLSDAHKSGTRDQRRVSTSNQ